MFCRSYKTDKIIEMMEIFIFWNSKYRFVYCSLAFKHQVTPWKVWRLAHGKMPARSMKEEKILRKLKEAKIIVDIV